MRKRSSPPPPDLQTFPLSEFIGETGRGRWRYESGEHVTILGPTGWGKTHLAYKLLGATATPKLPAITLVIKPRDPTAARWSRELDMPRVRDWPLMPNPLRQRKSGYTVWPKSTKDPEQDDEILYRVMRAALRDAYAKGDRIIFTDEAAGMGDLRPPSDRRARSLTSYMDALWMRGRSLGTGVWAASQRPVDISLHAYTQASHLFLGNDPDRRGRERYAEIGGIDPDVVKAATASLPKWHWLYIRRDGQRAAIISPG